MNKPDPRLTEQIQAWLSTEPAERDIRTGADLLLRLNRNRALHQTILRRPEKMAAKLAYELGKHLRIRLDGYTLAEVVKLQAELMPQVAATLETDPTATHSGRRADHDQLPEHIRAIYEQGGEIFRKMKQIYETLRTMDNRPPCDRYEHLQILAELDSKYRRGWETYDTYSPEADAAKSTRRVEKSTRRVENSTRRVDFTPSAPAADAKAVAAARKYLSRNKAKLATLTGEEADRLRAEMQQRIDLVLSSGGSFDEAQREAFISLQLTL